MSTWAYFFAGVSIIFILITAFKSEALLPINFLWMRFGLLLGTIINPLILGIIFFGLITPIAIFTRLIGRDELYLKLKKKDSYWISVTRSLKEKSFKNQF